MRELVIVGYGAAGFAALIRANELGVKPTVIGYGPLGGTCVNVGCVPSKRLLKLSREGKSYWEAFEDVKKFVEQMRKLKYEGVLAKYDVELIEGRARFVSPSAVKVNGQVIEGKKFVIATGSSPFIPEIPGLREAGFWTNEHALFPDRKVDSLIILGGRAQAIEFAQAFNNLKVEVAVLQRSRTLIPDWEPEVALEVQRVLEDEGVGVFTGVKVKEVRKAGERKVVVTNLGEAEADEVLVATGRRPNVDLGLQNAGVELNVRGGVKVNEFLQTTNPNVYAAGDVIGDKMLEPVAGYEGTIAAENALLGNRKRVDLDHVPQVIYTEPKVARVGLREEEVRNPDKRVLRMEDLVRANIEGETRGLIKMVVDRGTKRVLGVQMVGKEADSVIMEAALIVKTGMTVDDIIDQVHPFPSMSEALRLVALSFYKDVKGLSCCV